MGETGFGVVATVEQVTEDESLKWKAEIKAFGLSATADTIEDAVAEITPMIEKYTKQKFQAKKIVSAVLVKIVARAEFSIETPDNQTLDNFSGDDAGKEGGKKGKD